MSAPIPEQQPESTFFIKIDAPIPTGLPRITPMRREISDVQIEASKWPSEVSLEGFEREALDTMGRFRATANLRLGIAEDSFKPTIFVSAPNRPKTKDQHVDGDRAFTYGGITEYPYLRRFGDLNIAAALVHREFLEIHDVEFVRSLAVCLYKAQAGDGRTKPTRLLESYDMWIDLEKLKKSPIFSNLLSSFPDDIIEATPNTSILVAYVSVLWTSEDGLIITSEDQSQEVVIPPEVFLAFGPQVTKITGYIDAKEPGFQKFTQATLSIVEPA